jgi:hypothetical protein
MAVGDPARSSDDNEPSFLHDLAWHTAALLKLCGNWTLTCPASATVSWDTIAAADTQSVTFRMLDDVPKQIGFQQTLPSISRRDLEWVAAHWDTAFELRDFQHSRRFGLAFTIAYTWNHVQDARVAIANIWCGLEALFGVQTDRPVTRRLVERITAWLPDTAEDRLLKLYDRRCDAVHGRWLDSERLGETLKDSCEVLRGCLTRAIERGQTTLPDWGR